MSFILRRVSVHGFTIINRFPLKVSEGGREGVDGEEERERE